MGGLQHGIEYWWNLLRKFFLEKRVIRGELDVGHGDSVYVINTPQGTPLNVYASVEEPDDANTVCMGNINYVGTKKLPDGFVLYARIHSDTCIINWLVEFAEGDFDMEKLVTK